MQAVSHTVISQYSRLHGIRYSSKINVTALSHNRTHKTKQKRAFKGNSGKTKMKQLANKDDIGALENKEERGARFFCGC
jgi:hypothetical protein